MENSNQIVSTLKENQSVFNDDFEIKSLTMFGSYARNQQTEDSDLDLYFELEEGNSMPLRRIVRLEKFIISLTDVKKVEIFNYKFINPIIELSAQKDAIKIF